MASKIRIEIPRSLYLWFIPFIPTKWRSIPLWTSTKELSAPGSWNDLGQRQLLTVLDAIQQVLPSLDADEKVEAKAMDTAGRIRICKALLRISWRTARKITSDQWVDILPLADFLFETCDLTAITIKKTRLGFRTYHGPPNRVDNLTFAEFIKADTFFRVYHETKNPEIMDKLIAVLYRPAKPFWRIRKQLQGWDGDPRVSFNDKTLARRASRFRKISPDIKGAILYQYWGFRQMRVESFENVFPKTDTTGVAGEKVGNDYGWGGTLLELSGTKFGDVDGTGKNNWYTIMVHLSMLADQAREMELNRKRQSNGNV